MSWGIPQNPSDGNSLESVRWKLLEARNGITSRESLRKEARAALERTDRLPFALQRVEVTGVGSADDTSQTHPEMFNRQLKLSNQNAVVPSRSPFRDALKSLFAGAVDLGEALSDTSGKPTARSEKIISGLRGVRINELFAHSWGSEAVYLGILNGNIIPPKKLFILGVPDANEEKWRMLAKFTGIEVHVVGFQYDKLRIVGNAAIHLATGRPTDAAALENLWRARCSERGGRGCSDSKFKTTKFDYNIGVTPPDAPKDEFFQMHLSRLDHDRMLYYRYLHDRNLFSKTVDEMDAPQLQMVKTEEDRLLSEAMDEARSLIHRERGQD